MSVTFKNNSIQVKTALKDAALKWLEESSAEMQSQTQRRSRVKTGQTKGSYEHAVDDSALIAYIGSNMENAIWEEFGTGEYAIHGDGRKTPWFYKDAEWNGHWTSGKTANKPMMEAFTENQSKFEEHAKTIFKGLK